jgi:hypothetical protein
VQGRTDRSRLTLLLAVRASGSEITNSGTPAVRAVLVGFAVALAAVVIACYLLYRRDPG